VNYVGEFFEMGDKLKKGWGRREEALSSVGMRKLGEGVFKFDRKKKGGISCPTTEISKGEIKMGL